MTMVALAAAQMLANDVDSWGMPLLRAMLPIAGMTVIEHQAEQARVSGVTRLLVLVDGVPSALVEACDRMRARGLTVDLVRDGPDVIRLCAGATAILLIADGLVAGDMAWRAMRGSIPPAVLTTADGTATQTLERIDADHRWAGLAVLPGELVGRLSELPDDWNPLLAVFRQAVQDGAARITCDPALFVSGDMVIADELSAADAVGTRLLSKQAMQDAGIADRWITGPIVRLVGGPLLRRQNYGKWARSATIGLALVAMVAAIFGQIWPMAAAGIAAALSDRAGRFIAGFRPESRAWQRIAMLGVGAQLAAIAVADRGIQLLGDTVVTGSGGVALAMAILIGTALSPILRGKQAAIIDPATAWLLSLPLTAVMGWRGGFDVLGIIAGSLLLIAVLRARREVAPGAENANLLSSAV